MYIVERKNANYEITEYGGNFGLLVIKSKEVEKFCILTSFLFNSIEEVKEHIDKTENVLDVIKIIDGFSQNMEGYGYYGRNIGVSEEDYEEISTLIVDYFR